jgi:hypothetical protein
MLSVGLVGMPNAGKSTLFNLLTKRAVPAENYPFCTIDPHSGIVEVPDARVEKLARIEESQKKIFAAIEFHDIAGLVKNASKGEGLGNQFLSHIKEVDLILMVLRCFKNDDVIHVENRVDPYQDEEILLLELCLHDQLLLEKLLPKLEKELKGTKDPLAEDKIRMAEEILEKLCDIQPASSSVLSKQTDKELVKWRKSLNLLTDKPILKLANVHQDGNNVSYDADFDLDILLESQMLDMTPKERQDLGQSEDTGIDKMIKACYNKLNLATYLTAGPTETRAWTFTKGWKAPECAAVIHTDFEKNFIKAEIVDYTDFIEYGGRKGAAEAGKVRIEGKDYIMKDGDVVEFKVSC